MVSTIRTPSVIIIGSIVLFKCLAGDFSFHAAQYKEGKRFLLSQQKTNWTYANRTCKTLIGRATLAAVNSPVINEFIYNMTHRLIGGHGVWLGGRYNLSAKKWKWTDSSSFGTWTAWAHGQPDLTGGQDCLLMGSGYTWQDVPCTNRKRAACKTKSPTVDGGINWISYNGSNYNISGPGMTWHEAKLKCNRDNASLVKIENEEENAWIVHQLSQLPKPRAVWLGASDLEIEGDWRWLDNTSLSSWSKWGDRQPNDGGGKHCLAYTNTAAYEWGNYKCAEERYFVCQNDTKQDTTVIPTTPNQNEVPSPASPTVDLQNAKPTDASSVDADILTTDDATPVSQTDDATAVSQADDATPVSHTNAPSPEIPTRPSPKGNQFCYLVKTGDGKKMVCL